MSRAVLPALFVLAIGCGGEDASAPAVSDEAALTAKDLSVEESAALPLEEISGLGVRTIDGKPSYLAVGDSSSTLVTFTLGTNGIPKNVESHDLSDIFGRGDSQWEAVAGDGAGRTFIMSEGDATIAVLTKDLKLAHTITIDLADSPLAPSWDRDENSRGEGMVLLANGHILVSKEKGPSAIIELAPQGEDAAGYTPELALKSGAFQLPSGRASRYTVVAAWELKSSAARAIGDISDLAVDTDGTLLVLSDQSRAIARVERELSVDEGKIDLKALWDLPAEVEKPEGLLVVGGKPIVTCDLSREDDTSFFALSAL